MKLTARARRTTYDSLRTARSVLAEELRDPEFRAEWERTAPARAVALQLLAYRAEHQLSQTQLARKLGVSQAYIAELELGEHNPRVDTLTRLSSALGIEFLISIRPAADGGRSRWLRSNVNQAAVLTDGVIDGSRVTVAARASNQQRRRSLRPPRLRR